MRKSLLSLYPARWRARYGDEFESLLGERNLGPFDVIDIVLGALDARLHLREVDAHLDHRKGFRMSLRLGGSAAIAGGALWLAAIALLIADDTGRGTPGLPLFLVASIALLIGLRGLSAFQAREHPILIWAAFIIPAAGALLTVLGMAVMAAFGDRPVVADFSGWLFFIFGLVATIVGSGLFALATWRTAVLPRSGGLTLGIASIISLVGFASASGFGGWVGELFAVGLSAFAVGWIVVGWQAISLDQRLSGARPA